LDPKKRRINKRKHDIDLPECYAAFDGPMVTREDTREDYGEQRFVSLGRVNGRIVVLVWADGVDEPRLISCRKATLYEQDAYYREYPES
jgi:uncharacterized DUF497 family protein